MPPMLPDDVTRVWDGTGPNDRDGLARSLWIRGGWELASARSPPPHVLIFDGTVGTCR